MSPKFGMALLLAFGAGCGKSPAKPFDPDSVVSVQAGQIVVAEHAAFLKHLEISQVESSRLGDQQLRVVGQVLALAVNSDELSGRQVAWSELDPELSRAMGLNLPLDDSVSVGEAYGMADLPGEYAAQLDRGNSIAISRYGLRKYETSARVVSVGSDSEGSGLARVIFHMPSGEAWYPGNNCEVAFLMLKTRPVSVPCTALLHEGAQEYLLQETSPGHFKPRSISILNSSAASALVFGEIKPGSRIVSRGAILLKPLLHHVLTARPPEPNRASPKEARP